MPKRKSEPKKESKKVEAPVYDVQGKIMGKQSLPPEIFAVKIIPELVAQAVRIYLSNQRQGTKSTKTRSMVTGSTRKIYRQKGTGRARHGDIKAPIFIGGGIAHGPKPKDYSLSFPKKMRRRALFGALTDALQSEKIKIVKGLEVLPVKTRELMAVFEHLGLGKKKKISQKTLLVLTPDTNSMVLAGRNIAGLTIVQANQLHPYAVLANKAIVFVKNTAEVLEKTFVIGQPQDERKEVKPNGFKTEKKVKAIKKKASSKKIGKKKTVQVKPKKIIRKIK